MSETSQIINDTLARLFEERFTPDVVNRAEAGDGCADEWAELAGMGLPLAMVSEEQGGVGLQPGEAMELMRLVGRHAVPLPLGEAMLASHLAARAGLAVPGADGRIMTLAPVRPQDRLVLLSAGEGWRITGTAARVPWGARAQGLTVIAWHGDTAHVAHILPETDGGLTVAATGRNLAGEPRDALVFDVLLPADRVAVAGADLLDDVLALGAAMRAQMIAGAAESALEMTVQYANERVQFGRAIGKFQAIQQNLAMVAGQVAAAAGGADVAAGALDRSLAGSAASILSIGAGKSRASEAAGIVAAIAHQVHGAIGFTHEHSLHHRTRRLWSWRDEFGDEAYWNRRIGDAMAKAGGDGLWPLLTRL